MSQNDYVIANQTTPLFRSDLNLALQALASNSSGLTAPTTTYANMMWYDTTANILKMRNEADSAWINIGTLDQGANTFTPAGVIGTSSNVDFTVDPTLLAPRSSIKSFVDATPKGPLKRLSQTIITGSPSTVDFFFDETLYDKVVFDLANIELSALSSIYIYLSDNGSTFVSTTNAYGTQYALSQGASVTSNGFLFTSIIITGATQSNVAGADGTSGKIEIFNPGNGSVRTNLTFETISHSSATVMFSTVGGASRRLSTVTRGLRLQPTTGTFTSGVVTMYGVLKA